MRVASAKNIGRRLARRHAPLASGVPPSTLHDCWSTVTPGLELLLAGELAALGATPTGSEPGGIAFRADAALLSAALLGSRIASGIQVRIAGFRANAFGELERLAGRVDWGRVVAPGAAVHFRVTSRKSRLYHQDAIAERLERSVLAAVPGATAVRAASDAAALEDDPAALPTVQRLVVRVFRDRFTISADAAGSLLHRRGWRLETARAPLRETLAAALLAAVPWHGETPLADPFCGSGTIAIEAAQIARRMAPGRARRFAAESWSMLDATVFAATRRRLAAAELAAAPLPISAADRDAGAIAAARANAERADVAGDVSIEQAPLSALGDDAGTGWIVTNPPYGARVGERRALRDLYAALGNVARRHRPAWRIAILSADRALEQQVGVAWTECAATSNGGIPVRLLRG